MTVSGEFIAFLALALVAIIGGVLLLNLTKVVHMVVALVFTFLSIAGLYVLLSAEFLAVVQVLVYSGAISIIMLFGIMLTKHNDEDDESPSVGRWKRLFLLLGILAFGAVFYIGIYDLDFGTTPVALHENNAEQIGMELFSKYVIPFELMSVLLLVAFVGAIVLSRKDDDEKEAEKE
ncbi:NADH-quinone oxidoreductase subunit J [Mesobacillus maritimus]|uniref:NADH-quinone oxidoreductase subunit J n=1 Tax=Mesobacillus maritimus TaxID=1643336 RepID=UPI00203D7950|nr:NADH-quinone oxidoreductase subunit J [Mesobacillus maritimus]MCM3586889.1 NADH-quinone oxidoreductase subunit J [Mesobacillus maritimus]